MKKPTKLPPQPVTPEIKKLVLACNGLIDIVEGCQSVRWAYVGCRFKDHPEWVNFYNAWCKLNRP